MAGLDPDPEPGLDPGRAPRPAWVIGASGLLGSAVCRRLQALGRHVHTGVVPWAAPETAVATLLDTARGLAPRTEVFWCAGAGVVGSSEQELDREVAVLEGFLGQWAPERPGGLFLASSAGGVYAGSSDPPFTEDTVPAPLSPYGRAKLRGEEIATAFAVRTGSALLVGRLSNLYGPGQDLSKSQGLVSQLCRAQLTRQPLSVYVSLDTMRDYLFVDDAAAMVVSGLDAVADHRVRALKVLASERSTTVGGVLGALRRVTRRRPPVVLGSSAGGGFQAHDLRLRSVAWPRTAQHVRTPMSAGIASTLVSLGAGAEGPARPR